MECEISFKSSFFGGECVSLGEKYQKETVGGDDIKEDVLEVISENIYEWVLKCKIIILMYLV